MSNRVLRRAAGEAREQFVPQQILWTVQMKTFKAKMKQAAEQNLHQPSRCGSCTERRAAPALESFVRRKTTQLQNRLLEEKILSRLRNHTSAQLIAETLRDLPKLSDNRPPDPGPPAAAAPVNASTKEASHSP